MSPTTDQIREALEKVRFPGLSRDIVSFGFVEAVELDDGVVRLKLNIPSGNSLAVQQIADEAHQAVSALEGVDDVEIQVKAPPGAAPEGGEGGELGMARRGAGGPGPSPGRGGPGGPGSGPGGGPPGEKPLGTGGRPGPTVDRTPIPGVRHVIAVASGKGGVGKSTVAVNLAAALSRLGDSVGLMDADIYGPSVPTMLGAHEEPPIAEVEGQRKIVPLEKFGLRLMSLGFIQQGDDAVIWRGPLVMKAVQQFLRDVDWRGCDVLVIDLPPGTGDAQLTLTQSAPLTGAVIVTTPQDVALIDARKGLKMFRSVDVPVLGIVENMSVFHCPECGHESHIFRSGGGERTARDLGVPLLGSVPIDPVIAECGDAGTPIVTQFPDSAAARAFAEIAGSIRASWSTTDADAGPDDGEAGGDDAEGGGEGRSGLAAAFDRLVGRS